MPVVDLSTIGLDGQQAFATRMQTLAQADQLRASTKQQDLENEKTEKMNALNEEVSTRLKSVLHRDPQSPFDPEAIADKMNSLADPLEAAAKVYMTSGFGVETGQELLKNASEIRKREADMKNGEVKAQQERLDNIIKGGDIVSRWLGGATTPDEWELGKSRVMKAIQDGVFVMEPELAEQIKNLPFDPNAALFFRDQAISAADRARLERQDIDDQREDERLSFDKAARTRALELTAARDADQARYRASTMKATGASGSSLTPSGVEVSQARAILEGSVYKGVKTKDNPDVAEASVYVASLAKTIIANNKALSWDQAVQQAVVQGNRAGMFSIEGADPGQAGMNILGFDTSIGERKPKAGTASFRRTGATADSAMNPPITRDGKVDPSKLQRGKYYILSDGTQAKFDGKDFIVD